MVSTSSNLSDSPCEMYAEPAHQANRLLPPCVCVCVSLSAIICVVCIECAVCVHSHPIGATMPEISLHGARAQKHTIRGSDGARRPK